MSTAPPSPAPATPPDPQGQGQWALNRQRYLGRLEAVMDAAADVIEDIRRQSRLQTEQIAAAVPGAAPIPPERDFSAALDRAARTLRRTIALAERLNAPPPSRGTAPPSRTAVRKRILRDVEDAIQRGVDEDEADLDDDTKENLTSELYERLDDPELEEELAERPVAEIVRDLCRDLGVAHLPDSHPWRRRTPADIAELHARAARPSGSTLLHGPPSG